MEYARVGVCNGNDGLLFSGLYLGGQFGRICTSFHDRLQLRVRNMSSSLPGGNPDIDTWRLVRTMQIYFTARVRKVMTQTYEKRNHKNATYSLFSMQLPAR